MTLADIRDKLGALAAVEATARALARKRVTGAEGWYLVQSASAQSDEHAIEWLKRGGFGTYYPMVRERKVAPKRRMSHRERELSARGIDILRQVDAPLLPRYIFVRLDLRDNWQEVFSYAGVGGLVCKGGEIVRISDDLIAALQAREVAGAISGDCPAVDIFGLCEEVNVTGGAFVGFNGIVEELHKKRLGELDVITRLTIAIDIFGRPTPVTLDVTQVSKT